MVTPLHITLREDAALVSFVRACARSDTLAGISSVHGLVASGSFDIKESRSPIRTHTSMKACAEDIVFVVMPYETEMFH